MKFEYNWLFQTRSPGNEFVGRCKLPWPVTLTVNHLTPKSIGVITEWGVIHMLSFITTDLSKLKLLSRNKFVDVQLDRWQTDRGFTIGALKIQEINHYTTKSHTGISQFNHYTTVPLSMYRHISLKKLHTPFVGMEWNETTYEKYILVPVGCGLCCHLWWLWKAEYFL